MKLRYNLMDTNSIEQYVIAMYKSLKRLDSDNDLLSNVYVPNGGKIVISERGEFDKKYSALSESNGLNKAYNTHTVALLNYGLELDKARSKKICIGPIVQIDDSYKSC